jgi:hypothetical protein
MSERRRREDVVYGEGNPNQANQARDTNAKCFRSLSDVRKSLTVCASEADSLRLSRWSANDRTWSSPVKDNYTMKEIKEKAAMVFAIATVIAAWFAAIFVLYFHIFNA